MYKGQLKDLSGLFRLIHQRVKCPMTPTDKIRVYQNLDFVNKQLDEMNETFVAKANAQRNKDILELLTRQIH